LKNFNLRTKNLITWLTWLALVILWNYGVPSAKPLEDVVVAVILSLVFVIIKKFLK